MLNNGLKGDAASVVKATLKNTAFWGTDLTQFEGLEETVTNSLESIITNGMKATLQAFDKIVLARYGYRFTSTFLEIRTGKTRLD